jgi:ABC-2 type transport system permease protein
MNGTLDVSGTKPIPFSRLVRVELRKMTDTRSGFWLLTVIGVITLGVVLLLVLAGSPDDHTVENYLGATGSPQGFLLPVLGVLLVTGEWGQRATLTTFTLVPQRGRIVLAKLSAAVLFGLAAIAVAIVCSALATLLSGAADPWGSFGFEDLGNLVLLQSLGVLQGVAFGMLFLNSAAAIVTYFVLPIAFSIVTSVVTALHDAQPWIDASSAHTPLLGGHALSGSEWAHLATTTLLWVGLPLVIGVWRVLRAEVK